MDDVCTISVARRWGGYSDAQAMFDYNTVL